MRKSVTFSCVRGNLRIPASKSAMQRLVALSWLSGGRTEILNPDYCSDVLSALSMAKTLGADVERGDESLLIDSTGRAQKLEDGSGTVYLDCGESGLAIRMFSPIVSLSRRNFVMRASGSLMKRPATVVTEALKAFGVNVADNGGLPPLEIKGPLAGGLAEIDGSISSQILTGLLLALPLAEKDSEIRVLGLQSRPYIDMTLELAGFFGCLIENDSYEVFRMKGRQRYITPGRIAAEGDWSSASFHIAAAALSEGSDLVLDNLRTDSFQADRAILDVARMCGADVETGRGFVRISRKKGSMLKPFDFDASDCPDLFPPLVALATGCSGCSTIHGAQRLRHKESDREKALVEEFTKGGAGIESDGRSIRVNGGRELKSFTGSSHNDHRMAMALAVSAAAGRNTVIVEGAEAVSKSYPGFFGDIKSIGGIVNE